MTQKKEQNANNHSRIFPLHHFFITPLSLFFLIGAIVYPLSNGFNLWMTLLSVVLGLIIFTLPIVTRIYGIKNQDRIIRLELRQRYFELTGKRFFEKEKRLHKGQLIALRFASDDELELLIDKAINEQLSSKQIKQSIKSWQPDYWRV